jgi:hypothetical protein
MPDGYTYEVNIGGKPQRIRFQKPPTKQDFEDAERALTSSSKAAPKVAKTAFEPPIPGVGNATPLRSRVTGIGEGQIVDRATLKPATYQQKAPLRRAAARAVGNAQIQQLADTAEPREPSIMDRPGYQASEEVRNPLFPLKRAAAKMKGPAREVFGAIASLGDMNNVMLMAALGPPNAIAPGVAEAVRGTAGPLIAPSMLAAGATQQIAENKGAPMTAEQGLGIGIPALIASGAEAMLPAAAEVERLKAAREFTIRPPVEEMTDATQRSAVPVGAHPSGPEGVGGREGQGVGAGAQGQEPAGARAQEGAGPEGPDTPDAPQEEAGGSGRVTGPRNKITEAERAARGMDPISKYRRSSPREGFEAGQQVPEEDAMALAMRVAENPRQLEAHETGALSSQRVRLNQREDVAEKEALAARDAGNAEGEAHARQKLSDIAQQRDIVDHALTFAGTEQSGAFYARTMLANAEDNSFVKARQTFKVNHGREPSGDPADPNSEVARLQQVVSDHQKAVEDLNSHLAGHEAEQARLQERIETLEAERAGRALKRDAGREARATNRAARKADLDAEIADIAQRFQKRGGRAQMGWDPTGGRFDEATLGEVAQWAGRYAKLLVERNIKMPIEQIVTETWTKLKEHFEDISPRETRDLISMYGKVATPNPEAVATRLRETKAQMRLTSALEDAKAKVRPLKSGPQRDAATAEVRDLTKQVKAAIKEAGFPVTKEDVAAKMKSSLDAVKSRLKNEIEDLDKLIKTGQKKPRQTQLQYDAEAAALNARRDAKLAEYNKLHEGDLNQAKLDAAVASTKKSISELSARIKAGDIAPRGPKTSPWSVELGKLKLQQEALRDRLADLRKASSGSKNPLEAYKAHLLDRMNQYNEEIRTGVKAPPKTPKNPLQLDAEAIKLKAAVQNTRILRDRALRGNEPRTALDKFIDYARAAKLTGPAVIEKLFGASFWHHPTELASEPFGYAAGKIRVRGQALASVAEREGFTPGKGLTAAIKATMRGKGIQAALAEIRGVGSEITALSGGQTHGDGTLIGLPGRIHGAEKMMGIGLPEYERSQVIRAERAVAQGKQLDNAQVAMDISTKSAIDAQNAMLRTENTFSKRMTAAADAWTRGDKKMGYQIVGGIFKSLVPFGRFGANFLGKSIRMTGYGVLEGAYKTGRVALGKETLTPAVADDIIRAFKYGGLGAVTAYIGLAQPKGFKVAGYYAPNKVKPVIGSDGKPMKPGEIEIFGHKLPPVLSHAPVWNAASAWATFRNGLEHGERGGKGSPWQAVYQTGRGVAQEVPGMEDISTGAEGMEGQQRAQHAIGSYTRGMLVPGVSQQMAAYLDKKNGQPVKRKPKTVLDELKVGVPYLRQTVPTR